MKKFLKFIVLCVSLVMLASAALAGCGSKPAEQNASTTQSEAAAKKNVNLKFYTWEGTPIAERHAEVAKRYEEKNPGVKVTFEVLAENNATEYQKKLDLMLLSGDTGDIIGASGPSAHYNYITRGTVVPLNDFLAKEGIMYDNEYVLGIPKDGKYYALTGDQKFWFVMINKKHLEEAKLPVPALDWTWADYRDYAIKLSKGEGKDRRYGSFMTSSGSQHILAHHGSKEDSPYFKKDGSSNLEDPLFKNWIKFRYDLEQTDKAQVPYMEVKSLKLNYRDQFFTEKISILPVGSWMVPEIPESDKKYPHTWTTTFAPLPRWDKNTPDGMTFVEGHFYSINKNSANKEEAYKFLRYYTTEGMKIKKAFSTLKKANIKEEMSAIVGDNSNKLLDMDALMKVYQNPKFKANNTTIFKDFQKQLEDMFNAEVEKYLVGGTTLDKAFEEITKKSKEIFAAEKK